MRLFLLFGICQILGFTVYAQTTYYIASNGNDNNTGRSEASPFLSISKLNTLAFQPGDRILFRRGDTFRGTFIVQQSGTATNPISIDAYGTGEKPMVSGSSLVTNWTNAGGNVWQATCSSCGSTVTGLYSNGNSLPLGRYPNENETNRGYLTVQSHQGKTTLVSQQALATNWVGGEVVYRPTLWILNRAPIIGQTGNSLALDNASATYDISDGWGFFIQNHPATLDQNGEWYYNGANKSFRLLSTQNPNSRTITATTFAEGVRLLNSSNISVKNIQIAQTLNAGLYTANVSSVTITNNDIHDSGEDGMLIHGTGRNVLIENNTIRRVNNNATEIQSYTALTYRNNTVTHVALRPGRGKSSDGQYRAIEASVTTGLVMEGNRIDSIGYSGITFSTETTNATIRRNIISNFLLTKSDGGGIYTWNGIRKPMSNIKVQSNIIYKAIGALEGSPAGQFSGAIGIYMDQCTENVEISGNTVYDCFGIGIFLISVNHISVTNNTSFNNREGQFVLAPSFDLCPPRDNIITDNIFVSKLPPQSVARYESVENDLGLYGTIDRNVYSRPLDEAIIIGAAFKDVNATANNLVGLRDWQQLFGKDINSKGSPITYKGFSVNSLIGTNRIENSFFNGNALNWYTQSYYGNFKTEYDNTNKLDGGSMRLYFSPASGYRASYGFVFGNAFNIVNGRSYILRFDAVSSVNGKTLQAILRQRLSPANDLAMRVGAVVNTARQRYEIAFTASQNDPDAILMFSALEDGQSIWLDNITFQEASITRTDPDSLIKIAINNSGLDTLVNLDGNYRDVRNQLYTRQISLAPFTSAVLFRDTTSTVDLALSLKADRLSSNTQEIVSYNLAIRNEELTNRNLTSSAQWVCRLPPTVQFISGTGITNTNGVLTGQTPLLSNQSTTNFPFQLRLTQPGTYTLAAEITSTTRPDTDSTPGSGTADGEDDAQQIQIRTIQNGGSYASPNPNQRRLPKATLNEPVPGLTVADLMIDLQSSTRVASLNQILSYTVVVTNIGGGNAPTVQVQTQLPTGFIFVDGANWSATGNTLTGVVGNVPAGTQQRLEFRVRTTSVGNWTMQTQIILAGINDPDSMVNNGYTNGEDDRAATDIRVR